MDRPRESNAGAEACLRTKKVQHYTQLYTKRVAFLWFAVAAPSFGTAYFTIFV